MLLCGHRDHLSSIDLSQSVVPLAPAHARQTLSRHKSRRPAAGVRSCGTSAPHRSVQKQVPARTPDPSARLLSVRKQEADARRSEPFGATRYRHRSRSRSERSVPRYPLAEQKPVSEIGRSTPRLPSVGPEAGVRATRSPSESSQSDRPVPARSLGDASEPPAPCPSPGTSCCR